MPRSALFRLAPVASLLAACGGEPAPAVDAPVAPVASVEPPAPATPPSLPAAQPAPSASSSVAPAAPAAPPAPVALPRGLRVLVIGDSFAEALGVGLKTTEADNGARFVLQGEKATYIPEWAGPNRNVAGLLVQFKPDLVVVALGGNELAMVDPSVRAPKIQKLVEIVGQKPCVWVSPPTWGLKDNGLLALIQKNVGPCRYFDSDVHAPGLPRGSDKIHPTAAGQRQWALRFVDWLAAEHVPGASPFALRPAAP